MRTEINMRAPSLNQDSKELFERAVYVADAAYGRLCEDAGFPFPHVTAVLADDFGAEVRRHLAETSGAEAAEAFPLERIGGVLAAKNIDMSSDYSAIVAVFNAGLWTDLDEAAKQLQMIHVVAHELAHPLIERGRHLCGSMDGVMIPSVTGLEVAHSIARVTAGEYRADRLAEIVVGLVATAEIGGSPKRRGLGMYLVTTT